jgi:aerobic carbon-monoxide dehydrogenase medium subunit
VTVRRYVEPRWLSEASRVVSEEPEDARFLAGGTALTIMMRQGLLFPDVLVSLNRVADRNFWSIEANRRAIRIGGGVTLTDVAQAAEVARHLPSLAHACAVVGNVRVRNLATLGGNLAEADYASDPPAVLVSLDATVEVLGPQGGRSLPMADLVTGHYETSLSDGEIITGVVVPVAAGRVSTYCKFRSRSSEDRACVGVAVSATLSGSVLSDLEVVVGAVAATPQRDPDLGQRIRGAALDDSLIEEVASTYGSRINPIADARGSAWYRRQIIDVLVRRALRSLRIERMRP